MTLIVNVRNFVLIYDFGTGKLINWINSVPLCMSDDLYFDRIEANIHGIAVSRWEYSRSRAFFCMGSNKYFKFDGSRFSLFDSGLIMMNNRIAVYDFDP